MVCCPVVIVIGARVTSEMEPFLGNLLMFIVLMLMRTNYDPFGFL